MSSIHRFTDEQIARMVENSFKDFHTKGLDYICIYRYPRYTDKFYLFDGNMKDLPEVVAPHNHRYNFYTEVLCGASANSVYRQVDEGGQVFQRFDYLTPLNGGNGFTWKDEVRLLEVDRRSYGPAEQQWFYRMQYDELHTIHIHKEGTVLRLRQYQDQVDIGVPTSTFTKSKEPINLSGLYSKFTADEILAKLRPLIEKGIL